MQVALQSSFIRHLANVKHPSEMLPLSRGEQGCPDCQYPAWFWEFLETLMFSWSRAMPHAQIHDLCIPRDAQQT